MNAAVQEKGTPLKRRRKDRGQDRQAAEARRDDRTVDSAEMHRGDGFERELYDINR